MTQNQIALGKFCWMDVATPTMKETKQFFSDVLGWSYLDIPTPEGPYVMAQVDGKPFGGFMDLTSSKFPKGIPAHVGGYVWVESVDKTVTEFEKAGGTVRAPAFDVMDKGRMAVVADPFGAVLSLWEQKEVTPHESVNPMTPGAPSWWELMTHNLDGAVGFYSKIFGWKTEVSQNPQFKYVEVSAGGSKFAGMMQITKEMGPMPPNWGVYFTVTDCAASAKKAQSKLGKICMGPAPIPGVGTFAVLQEPSGVMFNIIQYEMKK